MAEQKKLSQAEWELWRGFFSLALTGTAQPAAREDINFQNIVGSAAAIADAAVTELKNRRASEGKTDITW
jgi:hypothetical protein